MPSLQLSNGQGRGVALFPGANKVFFRNVNATLTVYPWLDSSNKSIEVSALAYEPKYIPSVHVLEENGSVLISQDLSSPNVTGSLIGMLFVVVHVPLGAYVFAEGNHVFLNVGDIFGPLHLNLADAGYINVGRIASISATLRGSHVLRVAEVNGNSKLILVGDPRVSINGGRSEFLDCQITGSGKVYFQATCDYATADIVGSGILNAPKTDNIKATIDGSGAVYGSHYRHGI